MIPALIIGGDPRHGVVRLARELAAGVCELTGCDRAVMRPPGSGRAHLHFTDRLWGPDPARAAARIEALGGRLKLSVTLHDVPQASDGTGRAARRECYRRVVAAADAVVCNSEHEVTLLSDLGLARRDELTVIPLPVMAVDAPAERPVARGEVAVLGFVYPGKGHGEAIEAVGQLARRGRPAVAALGMASAGHDDDVAQLKRRARRSGVRFTVSGWLSEAELARRARAAAVPLAAHRHVSASGSIGSWIALGRRPLVIDSAYAQELDRLRPGTIRRFDPRELRTAIAGALACPESTWLSPAACTRPHLDDVAAAYLRRWAAW